MEPRRYSSSDHSKKINFYQRKENNKFCKGNEARILALAMCQIESRKMANKNKKENECYYCVKSHSLKDFPIV